MRVRGWLHGMGLAAGLSRATRGADTHPHLTPLSSTQKHKQQRVPVAHSQAAAHLCRGTSAWASRPSNVATSRKWLGPPLPPPPLPLPLLLPEDDAAEVEAVEAASWNRAMLASRSTLSGVPLQGGAGGSGGSGLHHSCLHHFPAAQLASACAGARRTGFPSHRPSGIQAPWLTCASACQPPGRRPLRGSRRTPCGRAQLRW